MRQAALYVQLKGDAIPRILVFWDHNDAVDWMVKNSSHPKVRQVMIIKPEFFKQGEQPEDYPVQQRLF